MGRRPWATAEQLQFLHSKVPELARAKATTGLNNFYIGVSQEFRTKWKLEPIVSTNPAISPEQEAVANLERVRTLL
jgi:hypothetical protein